MLILRSLTIARAETPYAISWMQQMGPSTNDNRSDAIVADSFGNIYWSGTTYSRDYAPDVYAPVVTKLDSAGRVDWSSQFGIDGDVPVDSLVLKYSVAAG